MFVVSPSIACVQFQRHAPQGTHFSRSKAGTPPASPGAMACAEQISMHVFEPQRSHTAGCRKTT